jgi:hypothetical protein
MSATISLVAPLGPGNWPAGAALTNLSASARGRYTSKLTCKRDLFSLLPISDDRWNCYLGIVGSLEGSCHLVRIFLFDFR